MHVSALQRRPATQVVPLSFAIQTFLPVVLEPLYLSDRWGSLTLDGIPLLLGIALVALGSVAISRTRAVSGLLAG